jgi:hypothetical protein
MIRSAEQVSKLTGVPVIRRVGDAPYAQYPAVGFGVADVLGLAAPAVDLYAYAWHGGLLYSKVARIDPLDDAHEILSLRDLLFKRVVNRIEYQKNAEVA